jgi:four helix bundle protein
LDPAFARYLFVAKSSNGEVPARLLIAHKRKYITAEEWTVRKDLSDEVARMITGLIKYLMNSDRRNRGLGRRTYDDSEK